jgi:hypothetical protein
MSDSKKPLNKSNSENSLFNTLIVPVLLALAAGGTAPWWISLFRESSSNPTQTTERSVDSGPISGAGNVTNDGSTNSQKQSNQPVEADNTPTNNGSTNLQGQSNQATIEGSLRQNPEVNLMLLPYLECRIIKPEKN